MDQNTTMAAYLARSERVRGCLVGGATGDALGWPVEFQGLEAILAAHGQDGVTELPRRAGRAGSDRLAEVTDDTQMTLFTAEALLWTGGRRSEVRAAAHAAYQRWLRTQRLSGPEGEQNVGLLGEPWLYASRAPGNACMSGLRDHPELPEVAPFGRVGVVNSNSKGCGTVMRSAPFGLVGVGPEEAFRLSAEAAQLTHGHPTGYVAAGAFAALVDRLVSGEEPSAAVAETIQQAASAPLGAGTETVEALERAVRLAAEGNAGFDTVERVGLGWIAEECLAIAVHCVLAAPADPRRALTLSVTHSGDSDSTGAVCGNLLGAAHGLSALPQDWAAGVEGVPTLLRSADLLGALRLA
ncbi:ADP-ribosylglycohydrolase family protein [Streptacidiphilus sp. MAP5-3]